MQFSIIIPTYNYGRFLQRALESCIAQECGDWELIVVDYGSTDDTKTIVMPYLASKKHVVRYVFRENQGPSAARNHGAKQASGDYLLFLDADDALLPQTLKMFRDRLAGDNKVRFLFGGYVTVSEKDGSRTPHFADAMSNDPETNFVRYIRKWINEIATSSALFHKSIFDTLCFPENVRNNEDVALIAQVLALYPCASFPDPVLLKYKHDGSLRTDLDGIRSTGTAVVDCLFDPRILPKPLMRYRDLFLSRILLSRFRSLYLGGRYEEADHLYLQAIRISPWNLLKASYLRKYLRLCFKTKLRS